MIYQRQRLVLALLDAFGKPVAHTDFQKLLFLYTRECETSPSYEFVPYRFGAFSFTSYADKRRLVSAGLLVEDDQRWRLTEAGRTAVREGAPRSPRIAQFCLSYERLRGTALIAEVYRRYPYYATRSEILDKVLPDRIARECVERSRPPRGRPALLTIGYEGKCLEAYLNQLLQTGVTLLCDVRRNPLSRKYGFSKGTLGKACEGVGIRYEHLPELGIASLQRRGLETQADYDALFAVYEREWLPQHTEALAKIRRWVVEERQTVALTCFELRPHQCHRHCVADALERVAGNELSPTHL